MSNVLRLTPISVKVAPLSGNVDIVTKAERKRRKYRPIKSYFEMVEDAQTDYRNRREIRAPPPSPPPPPPREEPESMKKPRPWLKFILRMLPLPTPSIKAYKLAPPAARAVKALALNSKKMQLLYRKFGDIDVKDIGQVVRRQDYFRS
jgi:hypothetical protein